MIEKSTLQESHEADERAASSGVPRFRSLFRRFFWILTIAAILPLAGVGVGAYCVFSEIIYAKSVQKFQSLVESHAAIVEIFLAERLKAMELASSKYSLDEIVQPAEIEALLKRLNGIYSDSFQDLGVIDENGRHLAYVGAYDLLDKNYRNEAWFERVSEKGYFISDVFLGFRETPHFIIAVRQERESGGWILRASIDSDIFSNLVARGAQGESGDCFVIDRKGKYQTRPRQRAGLLDDSGIDPGAYFSGVHTGAATSDGHPLLRAMQWIDEPRWLLVVQQEEAEFMASVREATVRGMAVFLLGVLMILAAAAFTTRYLLRIAEDAFREKEDIARQFMQASKLAAIGELATGLAHEINNPLAIILSEQTNIGDLLGEIAMDETHERELTESVSLVKKQVLRCRSITQKMLKFGRQGAIQAEIVHPDSHLEEIVRLLGKQAAVNNIDLRLEVLPDLPKIRIDSGEFEQVLTNLITNAMQAVRSDGTVLVRAVPARDAVHFSVEDTGAGISPELLDRIFTPFFTTKPVGLGTGLGLSVCYGIVTKWKGRIWAESEPGKGAVFHFTFPNADGDEPSNPTEGV